MNGPLLVIHPGSDTSTGDVYQGLVPALKRLGVPVVEYPLNAMIALSGGWLRYLHRRQVKRGGPLKDTPPSLPDLLYHASAQSVERCLFFNCEWVLLLTGMYFDLRVVKMLRAAGRKVAVLLTESPYDTSAEFAFAAQADVCWTIERTAAGALSLACPRTHYLRHAYDPAKHRPADPRDEDPDPGVPAHDVVFVGSGFKERIELLSAVDWSGIDFGLYGVWRDLHARHPLRAHLRGGETDNRVAAALYRKAKIGLNLFRSSVGHGDKAPRIAGAESLNPRLVELAACGSFAVSEWRREVGEVFGGAVPTFRDAHGLAALLKEWLPRDADRARRAASLPARVADRTFDAMARQVVRDVAKAEADAEPWRPLEERLGAA